MCCEAKDDDIAIDATQLESNDPREVADIDIYVSTLTSPLSTDLKVVREMGLISTTFVRAKRTLQYKGFENWVIEQSKEAESARALAMASLRTKAKSAGANALFGVKLDIEGEQLDGRSGYTLIVATGTAVVLSNAEQQPLTAISCVVVPQSAEQALYVGNYKGGSASAGSSSAVAPVLGGMERG
jgi:uncharacterized protein YbjQ (UPF0145 family)